MVESMEKCVRRPAIEHYNHLYYLPPSSELALKNLFFNNNIVVYFMDILILLVEYLVCLIFFAVLDDNDWCSLDPYRINKVL